MLAYRLLEAQTQPEFQDVPEPHAGPGQVVVKVAEATRTDIAPFLEAVRLQGDAIAAAVGRPIQMSLELPAPLPPRRVSRETKFQQDAKGNIVGIRISPEK